METASALEHDALTPSKLGTQDYWNLNYGRELESFHEIGDEGEVWFGEESSDEILDWIARHLPSPLTPTRLTFPTQENESIPNMPNRKDHQILDVGCGNGQLLFLLAQGGYSVGCLTGIDYSESSIGLSNQIAHSKGIEGLRLEVKDIIREKIDPPTREADNSTLIGWDLITDKGTFDAICLSEDTINGRRLYELYPQKILDLLVKPGGIFLITSCNWTEQELIQKFVGAGNGFKFHSKIPRASFSFGGSQGSTITTIAFQAI